ncbi:DEAD/DEAH box helicase [Gloeothece verrucosa]|uniref:Type III restriction protein res subunit n=1 Tax=Gloeothece verrucosa (strain PCC 7822) TaxID=497965 RepID=E0UMB7_GLOV7|nr:DEAD/DEAH box helicase [Gloeothece verrucosa]ADN18097.1 type III restriction protein res subunit [Gloeothece verrucosa PCC 7822]
MQLRPYQTKVIEETHFKRKISQRILIIAGTGAGKTVIGSRLISDFVSLGQKVIFLVHRDILIKQTLKKLEGINLPYGIIAGSYPENLSQQVQIASIQTLSRRGKQWLQAEFPFTVAIFDESHLTNWFNFSLELCPKLPKKNNQTIIGLTATPWRRLKSQSMGDIYETSVLAPLPIELIEQGFLVPFSYYSIGKINKKGLVLHSSGEYTEASLKLKCNTHEMRSHIVSEWIAKAKGRKTIAFTIDIEHAQALAADFNAVGMRAAKVDGTMGIDDREKLYAQLDTGDLQVLCSCEALSEGFDVPIVSCVILARLTTSRAKYFQQIGRGARIVTDGRIKRDCLVLDPVGMVEGFGFLESLTKDDFNIEPSARRKEGGEAPVKQCPGCDRLILAAFPNCPECKFNFPPKHLAAPPQPLHLCIPPNRQEHYQYYQSLLRQAFNERASPSIADGKFKQKYGYPPPLSWRTGAIFGNNPTLENQKDYQKYLQEIATKNNFNQTWIEENLWELKH